MGFDIAILCIFKIRCYTSAISASGIFISPMRSGLPEVQMLALPGLTVVEVSKTGDINRSGFPDQGFVLKNQGFTEYYFYLNKVP